MNGPVLWGQVKGDLQLEHTSEDVSRCDWTEPCGNASAQVEQHDAMPLPQKSKPSGTPVQR
jgi:hypothetical protein